MPAARKRYRVIGRPLGDGRQGGITYHPHGDKAAPRRRAEAGQVVDDLPPKSVPWLLAQRIVMESAHSDNTQDGE